MEKKNENLQESVNKITSMMYYDSEKTAFENEEVIEEQMVPIRTGKSIARQALRTNRKSKAASNRDAGMSRSGAREIKKTDRKLDRASLKGDNTADADIENSTYEEDFEGNNLKHIDRFVRRIHRKSEDLDKYFDKLSNSMHNGVRALDAVKTAYKEKYGENLPAWGGAAQVAPATSVKPYKPKYPPCQGGMNKLGCKSNSIVVVQHMLKDIKVDGMFGPSTQKRLAQVAPEFSKGFTDSDIPKIRKKLNTPKPIAPGKVDIKSFPKSHAPRMVAKPDAIPPREVAEGGYTNMAQGFVNESTISHEEMKRRNKQERLDKKLGRA